MTEPLLDAQELLRGLHNHKVEYVLFGALAMIIYGYARTTEHLDVVVAPDQEKLDRVTEVADLDRCGAAAIRHG